VGILRLLGPLFVLLTVGCGTRTTSAANLAGELVLANSTGRAMVLEAATGRLLKILEPANAGRNFSGVAVAGGSVYWLSGEYLNAWGLP
jgi:hypothetical protein